LKRFPFRNHYSGEAIESIVLRKVSRIMPTQEEIEALEEDLAVKESAYRRALAKMIAMAKLTLAANLEDTDALEQPGGGEVLDPPLTGTRP
jgi:hypothetical protein